MKIKNISLLLTSIVMMSPAYSVLKNSLDMRPTHFVAQHQQPVTVDDTEMKPMQVDPERGGGLACPTGYALTSVDAKAQSNTTVTVYRQCNGIGAYYVHSWCGNDPANYKTVSRAPVVTYTCKKLENKWVALKTTDDDKGSTRSMRV